MQSAELKAKAATLVEEGDDKEAKATVANERKLWLAAAKLLMQAEQEVLNCAQVPVSPNRASFFQTWWLVFNSTSMIACIIRQVLQCILVDLGRV